MAERRAWQAAVGSLVFLVVVPGTVAGWVPYWLTRWQPRPAFPGFQPLRWVGWILLVAGVASLVEAVMRFALVGLGTPAPVAAPSRLVISGQYRHVRNPMYVAVVTAVTGQGLVLGSVALLEYGLVLGLLFHAFVVLYEEPTLGSRFGASYEAYRRNVRRWWPRATPWVG